MSREVPVAELPSLVPVPFLLGAQHRLLMRSAHDDAVFVGEPRVVRIVFSKGVVPHCGPEIVALQTKNHFEQTRHRTGC